MSNIFLISLLIALMITYLALPPEDDRQRKR